MQSLCRYGIELVLRVDRSSSDCACNLDDAGSEAPSYLSYE